MRGSRRYDWEAGLVGSVGPVSALTLGEIIDGFPLDRFIVVALG